MHAINGHRQTQLATKLQMADTVWTRLRGLMGRTGLDSGEGLWIVPCRGIHTHGMAFSIDVLFLDRERAVVGAEENLPPGRFAAIRWLSPLRLQHILRDGQHAAGGGYERKRYLEAGQLVRRQ